MHALLIEIERNHVKTITTPNHSLTLHVHSSVPERIVKSQPNDAAAPDSHREVRVALALTSFLLELNRTNLG